jgi:UDP-N-acetylmuramate--alanine ligase
LAESVRSKARGPVHLVASLDDLPAAVATIARAGDLIVTMGAGSIGGVGDRILAALGERSERRIQP